MSETRDQIKMAAAVIDAIRDAGTLDETAVGTIAARAGAGPYFAGPMLQTLEAVGMISRAGQLITWIAADEQPEPEPTPEDMEEARELELCIRAARLLRFDEITQDPVTEQFEGHRRGEAGPPHFICNDAAELARIVEREEQHERA